ncbi:MAG: PadR family transcriptional regulator [Gorillibacterium sp.]|nr:PadR family transcriptional regulator [Gorillibacterium sp.]
MTKTMILGLLNAYGPMSGYKIKQMMESSQTEMWAYVQPASIYHALRKLQADCSIILESLQQTGLRTTAIYKITEAGTQELKQMLERSFAATSVVFPAVLYTALTFMHELPDSVVVSSLQKQESEILKMITDMQAGEQAKLEYGAMTPQAAAVFRNIYAQCELQLQFIREMQAELTGELKGLSHE